MKTLEELYNEILADEGLKEQLKAAAKENKVEEFLKTQGCEATVDEVKEFINSKKEVSVDELDSAAGGCNTDAVISACSLGIGCAIVAAFSASDEYGVTYDSDIC